MFLSAHKTLKKIIMIKKKRTPIANHLSNINTTDMHWGRQKNHKNV